MKKRNYNPYRRWPWPERWDKYFAWVFMAGLIGAVLRGLWLWLFG